MHSKKKKQLSLNPHDKYDDFKNPTNVLAFIVN